MKTPRLKFLLFSLLALLLFASCGKEGDAKSMVEDFLDTYLVDNARSDTRFSRMDSTKMITPATVMALREHMKTVKLFKPNVTLDSVQGGLNSSKEIAVVLKRNISTTEIETE